MMNKKLLSTAIATMMALSTGIAMAAPVELDGSASYRYRHDTNTNADDSNGSIYRFTLNAKSKIANNLSVYARFAAEGLSKDGFGSDMIQNKDTNSLEDRFAGEIDQFGFIYTNGKFTYKVGKQDAVIGGTGLLYDSTGYLGKNNGLSGISITGTTGVTSVNFLAGQENAYGDNDGKIYAAHASFNPVKNLTLGGTLAKYDAASNSGRNDTNYYAVDAAYAQGKVTYSAEYAKSNADDANKAYDVGVSYAFDSKNSVSVTNYKVEQYADFYQQGQPDWGGMTTFDENKKGFYYAYTHKFTKDTSATLFYRNMKDINTDAKNTSLRATVNYNF